MTQSQTIKCEACGHPADTDGTSTWRCTCHAGQGKAAVRPDNPDGCACNHINMVDRSELVTVVRTDEDGDVKRREVDLSNPPSWYDPARWSVEGPYDPAAVEG